MILLGNLDDPCSWRRLCWKLFSSEPLYVVIPLGNSRRQNVILVIPQVGKDFLADIVLKNFFMSIIPLGNIDVMGNFSEIAILSYQNLPQFGHLILDWDRKIFWQKFCPSLGCLILTLGCKNFVKNFCPSLDVWSFSGDIWGSCPDVFARKMILRVSFSQCQFLK